MALRLGEILVKKKLITDAQLEAALKEQIVSGKFLGEILIEMSLIDEADLLQALAQQFNTRFVSLENVRVNPAVMKTVPRVMAAEHGFLPIEMRLGIVLIAVSNPLDMWPVSVLQDKFNVEVQIVLAKRDDIEAAIERNYGPEQLI